MKARKLPVVLIIATAAAVAGVLFVPARAPADTPAPSAGTPAALVARGEYLTHGAGQCMDCHGAMLAGAPMHVPPNAGLADRAPSLIGLPMFAADSDALTFLTTTKLPDGKNARPPMPRYTFNTADATAIVAYLRSLK